MMHPGRILSQALALLAAQHGSEQLSSSMNSDDTPVTPPSYTDGVCDNKEIAGLPFCDGSLSLDERVDDLVARIPLEETFGLLVNNASAMESVHLPPYGWWSEGLHGVALSPAVQFEAPTSFATSFPQVINLAGSFNRTLFYKVGEVISTEARAFYNAKHAGLTFWTPNVNIFRDPRWGRGQETPGEDPFLSGEYAVAFVRGLQGEVPEEQHHKNGSSSIENPQPTKFLKVSATCKHFSSYSQEVPRHRNDAIVTKRDQLDTYFPAFEDCVKRGHVSSLMCSYNAVNGVPACADKALLTDLVRNQWGFDGYIVSDCGAVADIIYNHHYTQTPEQTCATTMNAGMDLNCGDFLATHAKKALDAGLLRKPVIHKALKNLFRVQMRLGMFEKGGQPFANITSAMLDTSAHRQLALEAARQAVVLLKNENATLPLNPGTFSGNDVPLALIGPHFNASDVLLGNYQGIPSHIVTPLEGIAKYTAHVTHALGCKVSGEKVPDFEDADQVATSAAQVILFVGLDQTQEREEIDRTHLKLPGFQNELIELVLRKAKTPIVLVIISGGGVDLAAYKNHPKVGAIIYAGYLGQAGGQAIADVLFGAYNPSGKLTQTFYTDEFAQQVSIYDMNMRPTPETGNPGRTYRFLSNFDLAVYSVGGGLSYTEFQVEWQNSAPTTFLDVEMVKQALLRSGNDEALKTEPTVPLNVTVTNVGKVDGEYAMTVFTSTPGAGTDGHPICYLSAFDRTPLLKPQEKTHFQFQIPIKTFALANAQGEWEAVEGKWHFQVGTSFSSSDANSKANRHEVHIGSFKKSGDDGGVKKVVIDEKLEFEPLKDMHMHAVEGVLEMERN